jgi:hypothetical protein
MTVKSRRFLFLAAILVALNSFFWLAGGGMALPKAIIDNFFGNRMVRAEVIVQAPGGAQDWRIDRGVVTAIAGGNVTVQEADGSSQTIAVDPAARIQGFARKIRLRQRVVLYHQANQPAELVQVEG